MQLYREAARILQLIGDRKGSVKNLTYNSLYHNKRKLYALLCETIKYQKVLDDILDKCQLGSKEKLLRDLNLTRCLIYDFLFGRGISGSSPHRLAIERHSAAIKSCLARIKVKANVSNDTDLQIVSAEGKIPRYVRVNTLKCSTARATEWFNENGFTQIHLTPQQLDYYLYVEVIRGLTGRQFIVDAHIRDLLVFSPGTEFTHNPLFISGDIILQDKASCLPPLALNPPPGSHIIDSCAAPGNKTTLLAALISNSGQIYAFDRAADRHAVLTQTVLKAGASCVTTQCADFLAIDTSHELYSSVEYVLVDPTCSGSGIVGRLNVGEATSSNELSDRLQALSAFQTKLLRHSLTFPRARRVVYSTCSVHEEENECVVRDVLDTARDWRLVPVLEWVPTRGRREVLSEAECCARLDPVSSLTGGFFVATLQRTALDEEEKYGDSDRLDHACESVARSQLGASKIQCGGRKPTKSSECSGAKGVEQTHGNESCVTVVQSKKKTLGRKPGKRNLVTNKQHDDVQFLASHGSSSVSSMQSKQSILKRKSGGQEPEQNNKQMSFENNKQKPVLNNKKKPLANNKQKPFTNNRASSMDDVRSLVSNRESSAVCRGRDKKRKRKKVKRAITA